MKNKKANKKHEEESSSDSDSSESDSSSSSSQSRDSSPAPNKSKREVKGETKKRKSTKYETSDDERDYSKKVKKQFLDDENLSKSKQNTVEHSKWDSPQEKYERKDKKSERHKRSDSVEPINHKSRSGTEKEYDLERRHKDGGNYHSKNYDRNRSEERHRYDRDRRDIQCNSRDHQNNKYEKRYRYDDRHRDDTDRDESSRYKNRGDKRNRRSEDFSDKKYSRDRSSSTDQNKNKSDGHQSRYRNRRHRSRSSSLNQADVKWGKGDNNKSKAERSKEKEKPNFTLSGKLTEETNTYRGVVIKYSEPPEARKPKRRWRLYPFKGEKALQTLYIHRESAYLIGRERKVVDLPVDHPSCSKQHAVLQYRLVPFTREDGSQGKKVRPYLIDLDSANGTFINNKKIDLRKYVELLEKDVIKFGYSSREYVLLHENSKDEAQDDDVKEEEVFEPVKKEKDEDMKEKI